MSAATDPLDLSGRWDGVFGYPGDALPTTPFVAEIDDAGGAFVGTTIEPDLYRSGPAIAHLRGLRAGQVVDFTKTYGKASAGYPPAIDYVGQISADGLRIAGSWTMQEWSGWFEMTRDEPVRTVVEVEAEEALV